MFGFGNYAGPGLPPGTSLPFGNADAFVAVLDGKRLVFRDCSWGIVSGLKAAQASWCVLAGVGAGLTWEIKTYQYTVQEASWRLLAPDIATTSSWLILQSSPNPLAWGVLARITKRHSWIVLNGVTTAPSWRILNTGPSGLAWGIESARAFVSGWKVSNLQGHGIAWGIANALGRPMAWGILTAVNVDVVFATLNTLRSELAAGILARRAWPAGWRIQPALLAESAWSVRGGAQAGMEWDIEAVLETETASRVLGATSIEAAWDVFAYERLAVEVASQIMTRKENEIAFRILHVVDRALKAGVLNACSQKASWSIVSRQVRPTDFEVLPRHRSYVVRKADMLFEGPDTPDTHEVTLVAFEHFAKH